MNRRRAGAVPDCVEADDEREVLPSRIVLSVMVTGIVIVMICGNLSSGGLQGSLHAATQPIRTITGLNQHWDAFAPDPRTNSFFIDGRVDFADGTSATYPIVTRQGPGAYVDYRWHKYEESLRPDLGEPRWPSYARYLAGLARADGREPVRVTLIRRSSDTLPPGPGPERGPWTESTLFVLDIE